MIRFSGISDEAGKGIDAQIRAHKELGWKYIELRNVDGVNVTDLCEREFDGVAEKVAASGLQVSCFASQLCNWSRPIRKHEGIDVDELSRAIPRMRGFGTEYIRVMSYGNAGWPEEEWKAEVVRRLRLLARMAEDGGVTLVHENCDGWGGVSPENALELLELVDSPAFQLLYDTGNPVAHDQDPSDFWTKVRDKVIYVHIKDGRREGDKLTYTYCGDGEGIVPEVLADLCRMDYDGFVSIEPHLAGIVHEAKEAESEKQAHDTYVAYGRRLMEEVKRAGGEAT
jgi:sugar phosphate isomerase/epimerase